MGAQLAVLPYLAKPLLCCAAPRMQAGALPGHWPHVTLALGQGFNLTAFALSLLLVFRWEGGWGHGRLLAVQYFSEKCLMCANTDRLASYINTLESGLKKNNLNSLWMHQPAACHFLAAPTPATTGGGRGASCGAAWSTARATSCDRWATGGGKERQKRPALQAHAGWHGTAAIHSAVCHWGGCLLGGR